MSNEAINAVARSTIRPSGRKFVAMALADYADEAWSCFPSVAQLAAYTCQGEKTVRDHLAALEESGCIDRERQRRADGTLGRYLFVIQRRNLPVAKIASGEKPPKPAAKSAAHNPQEEPSSFLPQAREATPLAELRVVLDEVRAKAVVDHRQRIRKPLTAHAAKLLAGKFAQCPDPNGAADVMIGNGWQGFEPDWLNRPTARGSPAPGKPLTAQQILKAQRESYRHDEPTPDRPVLLAPR